MIAETIGSPRDDLRPYCRNCWFPATKPNSALSQDLLCRACASAASRVEEAPEIWLEREAQFSALIRAAVARKSPNFDVLVPVSGGKDSITQVVRASQHGARILAVSVDYGVKTEIGRRNLDAVPGIGSSVHLQVYRPPLEMHRRLILDGLTQYGDPDLFSHTLLHAYPLHQAIALQIPLVVLGENSAAQYGGTDDLAQLPGMTREWFESYAVSGGHSVMATSARLGIEPDALRYYDFPDQLPESDTETVFLSSFFPWDSEVHLDIARRHGFEALAEAREGTFRNYVGIDEHINRIHQYLKLLKFGYGRTTDHACEEIRLGRLTRLEARSLIARHELAPPTREAMVAVAGFLRLSVSELAAGIEAHRNLNLWVSVDETKYVLPGFLELEESPPVESLVSLFES